MKTSKWKYRDSKRKNKQKFKLAGHTDGYYESSKYRMGNKQGSKQTVKEDPAKLEIITADILNRIWKTW